jgi:hypothetical protein
VISSPALALAIVTFCRHATSTAFVELRLITVEDNPFGDMYFAAVRAGSESKQLAITNHLFSLHYRATDQSLEVILSVCIPRVRKKNRLAVAGTEILCVCHVNSSDVSKVVDSRTNVKNKMRKSCGSGSKIHNSPEIIRMPSG